MVYGGTLGRKRDVAADRNVLARQPATLGEAKKAIAGRVKQVLAESEETGVAVAGKLGVHPSRVSRWKTGAEVPLKYLPLLPTALGVSADWLLGLTDEKRPRPEGEAETILTEIEKLLARRSGPARRRRSEAEEKARDLRAAAAYRAGKRGRKKPPPPEEGSEQTG